MDVSIHGFKGLTDAYDIHADFTYFPVARLPAKLLFRVLGVLLDVLQNRDIGSRRIFLRGARVKPAAVIIWQVPGVTPAKGGFQ